MQSAVTFGWWFPRKSQHSNKEISLVFLANNAQSSKLRRKLSSWKKTFENVGISALLSHEESHWYSRYWINCCPLSKERGSNWRITGSSVVLPRSKQFTARTKWVWENQNDRSQDDLCLRGTKGSWREQLWSKLSGDLSGNPRISQDRNRSRLFCDESKFINVFSTGADEWACCARVVINRISTNTDGCWHWLFL